MKAMHILLVEDNEGDILLTTEALDDMGMDIKLSVAKDGKDAIDFMCKQAKAPREGSVNLVLLDVNLPKKNGHEVLKYIRGNHGLDHIPVVMLTTSCFQKDIDTASQNSANGYITKPLDPDKFPALLRLFENPDNNYSTGSKNN